MESHFCSNCNQRFTSLLNLKRHNETFHPDELPNTPSRLKCSECGVMVGYLRKHMKRFHADKLPNKPKQFRCSECGKEVSYLRHHLKRFHSDKVPSKPKQFTCSECGKKVSHLRQHIKRFHAEKIDTLIPEKSNNYNCDYCEKQFKYKHIYKRHLEEHNPVPDDGSVTHNFNAALSCPLCSIKSLNKEQLIEHYECDHNISIQNEIFTFANMEDFKNWKASTETQEKTFFKVWFHNKTKHWEKIKYICHRSGNFVSKGNNRRRLKSKGSNKINGYCPASMMVTSDGQSVSVNFQKIHVGHDLELERLPLTKLDKDEIAHKIASNVPFQSILDEIKVAPNSERLHLLTKKDLFNIKQTYNLDTSRPKNTDLLCIESWINERQDDVLFYKAPGTEMEGFQNKDFILIMMTSAQKEIMETYRPDCIWLDSTHDRNYYGYQLHTILVLNEIREAFPCALLVTCKNSEEVLSLFFTCVRDKLQVQLNPKVFMSDIAEEYYNAWTKVMSPVDVRLFCTWHVDHAWRKDLNKIGSKEMRVNVYEKMQILLQEKDVSAFKLSLENVLSFLDENEETMVFLEYFKTQYIPKIESWAYCYHINYGLDASNNLERLHETIKYMYLEGKYVKRLDIAINAILKCSRDKLYDDSIGDFKKLCTDIKNIRTRHDKSSTLSKDLVVETESGWKVASLTDAEVFYSVEKAKHCDGCQLVCKECEACVHEYSCTCTASCTKWNMCEHIHLVCQTLRRSEDTQNCNIEELGNDDLGIYLDDVEIELNRENGPNEKEDVETRKIKFISSFMEIMGIVETQKECDAIEKLLVSAGHIINLLKTRT